MARDGRPNRLGAAWEAITVVGRQKVHLLRKGNARLKITGSQTYVVGNLWKHWLFVRLETDEGLHGVVEGTLNGFARTVEAAIHELEPLYIGVSPFDVETITLRMLRDVYSDVGRPRAQRWWP